jgi:hypothetical protein
VAGRGLEADPGAGDDSPPDRARWLARAGRGFRILGFLLLPGLLAHYAAGNLAHNDFSVYYTAARDVVAGGAGLYSDQGPHARTYRYAPGFAVLVAPLAALPYSVAAVLWAAASLAAIVASLWLCLDLLGIARGPVAWTVGGLTLIASGRVLDSELGNGQANHWVLLGTAGATWLLARGRASLGGFVLSLAILAKATPLLIAAWLAAKREWKACAGVVLGLAALGILLPALVLGPRAALAANVTWLRTLVPALKASASEQPFVGTPGHVRGHSLRALVRRHATWTQAAEQHDEPVFVNTWSWSPRAADRLYRGLALAMLGATFLALGLARPRSDARWLLEAAAVAATMVLIAPLSRKAHFVVLLLPIAVAVARTVTRRSAGAAAWVLPPAALFVLTSPGVIGRSGAAHALAWGAYSVAALWLWAGALVAARRERSLG